VAMCPADTILAARPMQVRITIPTGTEAEAARGEAPAVATVRA
jgi:hypothetical protein